MKLSIKHRISTSSLLPQTGGILEQMTSRDILKKVEILAEEAKEVNLRPEGEMIIWDQDKDSGKEVEFSPTEIIFLKDQVEKLDKEKKITPDILDICLLIKEQK
jgi:hypothetical protein